MTDPLALLQEFYREKLEMLLRHQAGAQLVGQYDVNNTYQYIINREETHLSWLAKAITDLGGALPPDGRSERPAGTNADAVIDGDARDADSFVGKWRSRIDALPNARHARMLRLILGEVLEHKRFFEQAKAGRTDLLGRRAQQTGPAQGEVLPTRWIE